MATKKAAPIKKEVEVEEVVEEEVVEFQGLFQPVEQRAVAFHSSVNVIKLFYGQSASVVEKTIADWIKDTNATIHSASSCYDQRENVVITTVVATVLG